MSSHEGIGRRGRRLGRGLGAEGMSGSASWVAPSPGASTSPSVTESVEPGEEACAGEGAEAGEPARGSREPAGWLPVRALRRSCMETTWA